MDTNRIQLPENFCYECGGKGRRDIVRAPSRRVLRDRKKDWAKCGEEECETCHGTGRVAQ